eukprot:g5811.t1
MSSSLRCRCLLIVLCFGCILSSRGVHTRDLLNAPTIAVASARASATNGGSATATSGSTARDGGRSESRSNAVSDGGDVDSTAKADSRNGGTAVADSEAVGEDGKDASATSKAEAENDRVATSIARAFANKEGPATANAIAQAIKDGFGDAVAVAISKAIDDGYEDDASNSIAASYSVAISEGAGDAYSEALAIGLAKPGAVRNAFAVAISKVLKDEGCKAFKPTLASSRAVAIANETERDFMDALDYDIQVAECLLDACDNTVLTCCQSGDMECECGDSGCAYTVWKSTPRFIWSDASDSSKCLCPSAV